MKRDMVLLGSALVAGTVSGLALAQRLYADLLLPLTWGRTAILSCGSERCDFCWCWREDDAS